MRGTQSSKALALPAEWWAGTLTPKEQIYAKNTAKALTGKQEPCDAAGSPIRLTSRQKEILALIALGATDNEIACRLCLSSGYVSNQVKKIRRRLGACSRAHAVALALRQGMLETNIQQRNST